MERIDMEAGMMGKTGSGFKNAKRAFRAGGRDMEKDHCARGRLEQSPVPGTRGYPGGQALPSRLTRKLGCGGLEGALAREEGSALHNPYAMYTPGLYVRNS